MYDKILKYLMVKKKNIESDLHITSNTKYCVPLSFYTPQNQKGLLKSKDTWYQDYIEYSDTRYSIPT